MKISVVVVSHNTRYLLKQCLTALQQATENLKSEIILVDTGSEDDTLLMVMKDFPNVRITTSSYTKGCSKAYNQGIRIAKGEYLLLLRPEILVQPDAIAKSVDFMEKHQLGGGLGIRILDTEGNYLKASKKILPNAWVAFFKLTGLLKQFPRSRLSTPLHRYYEDEFDTAETDVLNSKFMLLRRSVIDKTGMLDERFMSYGSNIDLSYRIRLAGFRNYYFPRSYVIDQQSKTASRSDWQHLKSFYGAMIIFALKYLFSLPALYVKPMQEMYPAYELKG